MSMSYKARKTVHRFSFQIFSLVMIIVAIPVTVLLLQYQQTLRQHAQETALFYLLPDKLTASHEQEFSFALSVDSGPNTISAVQINLAYPQDKLTLQDIKYSDSAFPVQTEHITGNGIIRIGRDALSPQKGEAHIATLHFTATKDVLPQEVTLLPGSYVLRQNDQKNVLGGLKVIDSTSSAEIVRSQTAPGFWGFILETNESLWKWVLTTFGLQ